MKCRMTMLEHFHAKRKQVLPIFANSECFLVSVLLRISCHLASILLHYPSKLTENKSSVFMSLFWGLSRECHRCTYYVRERHLDGRSLWYTLALNCCAFNSVKFQKSVKSKVTFSVLLGASRITGVWVNVNLLLWWWAVPRVREPTSLVCLQQGLQQSCAGGCHSAAAGKSPASIRDSNRPDDSCLSHPQRQSFFAWNHTRT